MYSCKAPKAGSRKTWNWACPVLLWSRSAPDKKKGMGSRCSAPCSCAFTTGRKNGIEGSKTQPAVWQIEPAQSEDHHLGGRSGVVRSEERRVGKECRSRW